MSSSLRSHLFMCIIGLGAAFSLVLARPIRAGDKAAEKDLKTLQGTWIVIKAERDGEALDRIKGNSLIVKDNQFTVVTKSAELKGDLTLDPGKSPKRIDMQHQEGMLREKKWEGIYKFAGEELTLCYTEADSGRDRPDEFATHAGSSRLLIVMERKKP